MLLPPDDLLQDCVPIVVTVTTNGDLLKLIQSYRNALDLCNADKAALRAWSKQ